MFPSVTFIQQSMFGEPLLHASHVLGVGGGHGEDVTAG